MMRAASQDYKTFAPIMLAYALGFSGLWWLSKNLETVPGVISWFLPAGFRIMALCLVPRKRWWSLLLAEIMSSIFLTRLDFDYSGFLSASAAAAGPMLAYAVAMVAAIRLTGKANDTSIAHFPTIALGSMLGALLYGCLWAINLTGIGVTVTETFAALVLNLVLGDLVGIALFLPLLIIITRKPPSALVLLAMAAVAALAVLLLANITIEPYQYHWRVVMLIGIAVVAQRFGMSAACVSSWGASVFIVAAELFQVGLGSTEENQLAIVFVTLSALGLGHSVDKHTLLAQKLASSNAELQNLNNDYQKLARRLVDVSESERNAIAREIHDGLGQMLASIRIKLQLLRASSNSQTSLIDELDRLLGNTYDTARVLMNQLTPDALVDLGLEEALRASDIEGMCRGANIKCQFAIQINQPIATALQLQLFRIIQEAAYNCVKYAHANALSILLKTKNGALVLSIKDNGVGFDPHKETPGRGLSNIKDRASLINAHYSLTTSKNGTEHFLMIDLTHP